MTPNRIHLIAHANPAAKDVKRFGFADTSVYFRFIREHLPAPLKLTYSRKLFGATEDQQRGGRRDDAARVRDLQGALDDPNTLAIVAVSGGAYFSRLLPHVDFSPLARRRAPLWALGFSEMTSLVNIVASYRAGRGLYWLCPNYLAWRIKPRSHAQAAFAEFWRTLPLIFENRPPDDTEHLTFGPITGRLARGSATSGPIRIVGGCLSVLAAILQGETGRRIKPDGRWLALEDVGEPPYRIDRYLATLKLAGWFDHIEGILLGDFHEKKDSQVKAVLELLKFHLPRDRNTPIVVSDSFGHTWPIAPLPINRRVKLTVRGRRVSIGP